MGGLFDWMGLLEGSLGLNGTLSDEQQKSVKRLKGKLEALLKQLPSARRLDIPLAKAKRRIAQLITTLVELM
jgi:hypothetical protein